MPLRRSPQPQKGYVNRRGALTFSHKVTVGAAGAITTQDADSGVTATKQGTAGQYIVAVPPPTGVGTAPSISYKRLLTERVSFIGPAPGVNTVGLDYTLTNDGTTTGTWTFQFVRGSDNAAADVPSGTVLIFNIEVSEGI